MDPLRNSAITSLLRDQGQAIQTLAMPGDAMRSFTKQHNEILEGIRSLTSGLGGHRSPFGEALKRQSELLSVIDPIGKGLREATRPWGSLAELVDRTVVDRTALGLTITDRFSTLRPSAFLPFEADTSIVGFSRLVHLERASTAVPPFSEPLAELYDDELGDPVEFNELDTPEDRSKKLNAAGFNEELVAFAPKQQVVVLGAAGFRFASLNSTVVGNDDLDDAAVYDEHAARILGRTEHEVRLFIGTRLEELVGPRWIKQRIPGDMRKAWEERRRAALDHGQPECPLIFYANFMDLVDIIIRRDNWNDVFHAFFHRRDEVEVSFRRMHPIRLAIAHTRPIRQADVTLVATEAVRVLRAIGIAP